MFRVSRLWAYEIGVPHISQEHYEEKGTCVALSDTEPEDDS